MSYEVITAGELEFPSPSDREQWFASKVDPIAYKDIAKFFEVSRGGAVEIADVLAEYIDVTAFDDSMTYYLDLQQLGASVTVRGLVHRDGFQPDFLSVFASAAEFGANGSVAFQLVPDDDRYVLTCRNGRASFKETRSGVDEETASEIFVESMRRANPNAKPTDEGARILAEVQAMKPPAESKALKAIFEALERIKDPTQRRDIAKAIGKLAAATKAIRVEERKAKTAAKKLAANKSAPKPVAKKPATKKPVAKKPATKKPNQGTAGKPQTKSSRRR